MSHKHPDDAANVALLIDAARQGEPFNGRHRIIDTYGRTHMVLVVGERLTANDGAVIGSQGFYVDLSDFDEDGTVDAAVADFTANRALIEQAKGILMATYDISAERAFDILVWRSQETNTKLRKLVVQVIDDFTTQLHVPPEVRARRSLAAHRPSPHRPGGRAIRGAGQ
jgi:hypothetical protein